MDELFRSFLMGGFECSNHRLKDGRRLDVIASTQHDRFAEQDYRRMMDLGMFTARDGIRWHRVEREPGHYDWTSVVPMVRAARAAGIEVIWDLLHFGWPDHVDVFSPEFPPRFAEFARGFAALLAAEGDGAPAVVPVNEISFLAFAGGEAGFFNPFAHGRGDEMKRQLVRAVLLAAAAMRDANPATRVIHIDPIIHVIAKRPEDRVAAADHEAAQFHAWDMLLGRREPGLGGGPRVLDAIGVNYYVHNQWTYPGGHGSMVPPTDPRHRPLRDLLCDTYERYRIPLFVAETGIEDAARPTWLRYVASETRAAMKRGAEILGICLYPIVNHPGWDDDRHCYNGLWDYADARGHREAYAPLEREIRHEEEVFARRPLADEEPLTRGELMVLDATSRQVAEATESARESG